MNLSDLDIPFSMQRDEPKKQSWPVPQCISAETSTLTKADLASALFDHIGLSKREANEMVDAFFEVITQALESGESLRLSSFGNFRLRDKVERIGRNPRTGETISILARRVVVFSPSPKLNESISAEIE